MSPPAVLDCVHVKVWQGTIAPPLVSRHVSDVVLYETMAPGVTTALKNLIKAVGGCQRGGVRRSLAAGRLFS